MRLITNYFRELARGTWQGWNRFWFTPSDPATLGLIRILAGAMLFYTHLVWSLDLNGFFGPDGWLPAKTIAALPNHSAFEWSWFYWINSPALMWAVHIACLIVFALFTIGLWSRATSILAFLATVAYANRASLAQFGLDDTNAMLAMYLMIGPCGAAYSVDNWLKRRRAGGKLAIEPRVGANVAIRLLQVHLCVIYFFSGIGKAQGPLWWNGLAMLMATANYEYQSLSATWLIHYKYLAYFLTHLTVFWELSYCAGLAAPDPADCDRACLCHSPGHRPVPGDVDLWAGNVLCQHGVHFALDCAADHRSIASSDHRRSRWWRE